MGIFKKSEAIRGQISARKGMNHIFYGILEMLFHEKIICFTADER